MNGNIAVGSYQDLEPEPEQPIDRNPKLACTVCGEKHAWQDYWKDRILDGDGDPRDEDFWCDDCTDEIETLWQRRIENQRLGVYTAETDRGGRHD